MSVSASIEPTVFGVDRGEALRRVGALRQLARIDSLVEADGPERGARRLRMVSGGGLEVELHPDRCLDIGNLTVDGTPVAWMSPTGVAAPGLYDPRGSEWLRTFGGGLLATCGLDTFGSPDVDAGQALGQHGRVGAVPARITRTHCDEESLVVESEVRQASVLGENLVLRRRITVDVGSTELSVEDSVTNEGYADTPHMILYHANLGWPLVEDGAELVVPSTHVEPRDDDAKGGLTTWATVHPPVPGMREQVFLHRFPTDDDVTASITNRRLGLAAELRFHSSQLPVLYQWKLLAEGTYVVGLEPANCAVVSGRSAARAAGELPVLEPGERRDYALTFAFARLDGGTW
jgi:galactose mutarotase-like enzyme